MKHLFDERYEAYTELGNEIADKVDRFTNRLLNKLLEEYPDLSLRELGYILDRSSGCIISERILRRAVQKVKNNEQLPLINKS